MLCWIRIVCVILPLALISGCGDAASSRLAVAGRVTLDGNELESGRITFVPLDGGRGSGSPIENGEFSIPEGSGPSPGKYRVEITAYRSTGELISDPDVPGRMVETTEPIIPRRYNVSSELVEEFSASGIGKLEYKLKSG